MPPSHDPRQNHLLAALSLEDFQRVTSHLKLVPMTLGAVLYESGSRQRAVYFPTTAIVSLLYMLADEASAEIAVVGNEGIIGVSLFMGGETTPSRDVVQSAGHAYRLPGKVLKEEFTAATPCSISCCATHKRCSRKWPRQPCAIGVGEEAKPFTPEELAARNARGSEHIIFDEPLTP